MKPAAANQKVSLILTNEQIKYLEHTRQFIANATGCNVSTDSILIQLMEKGIPTFEDDMRRLRSKKNEDAKRFPRLHLAYTRA